MLPRNNTQLIAYTKHTHTRHRFNTVQWRLPMSKDRRSILSTIRDINPSCQPLYLQALQINTNKELIKQSTLIIEVRRTLYHHISRRDDFKRNKANKNFREKPSDIRDAVFFIMARFPVSILKSLSNNLHLELRIHQSSTSLQTTEKLPLTSYHHAMQGLNSCEH